MADLHQIKLKPENMQVYARDAILKTTSDGEIFRIVRDIQHDAIINGFNFTNCTDLYFHLMRHKKSIL